MQNQNGQLRTLLLLCPQLSVLAGENVIHYRLFSQLGDSLHVYCEKNNILTVKKLTQKMLGTLRGILYLCIGLVRVHLPNELTLNNFQI